MAKYQDIEATCVEQDCGSGFTITAGEQEFFADKGMTLPKRCPSCRQKRKAEKLSRGGNDRDARVYS